MSNSGDSNYPVGIVGAGPVGMTCALRLASFGIPSVLLEADPELRKQGSKACLIQGDVLEILDKVGCGDPIAAEGVPWHIGHTYVRGQEIIRTVYPQPIGFGPFINISQYRIQQILLERIEADPLCEIRWSHRVDGVSQEDDRVTATAATPEGTRKLHFSYLIACDGVRSGIRDLVGVRWTGYTHNARFLITDIKVNLPLPKDRHFHYDPPFNPGKQLVIHPQPDNMWRIDWQLSPGTDIQAERRNGQLERRIRAVIGDLPYEIDWLSTYRFYQRVVEHFRVARVLFAGDAAHALPPYGARGMNSGLQDADNLCWKLARVINGQADESLLDTYHEERYAAARENLRVTEATIQFMVPPTRFRRWIRDALLWLSTPFKGMRRHVNAGRMAEPYVYRESSIVERPDESPLVGTFAPDGEVLTPAGKTRLRRLLGHQFVCLYFGADPAAAREFVRHTAAGAPGEIRFVLAFPAGTSTGELPDWVAAVHYQDRALAEKYAGDEPRWYLVRPDGHIATCYSGTWPVRVGSVLERCTGGGTALPAATADGAQRPAAVKAS